MGVNRTKFSGDQPTNGSFGPKLGPMASLNFNYRITQAAGIRIETGYINQRANFIKVDSNNKVSDSLIFVFSALSFPINAVIWTKSGRFFVSAGLGIQHFLNARAVYPDQSIDIS